MPLQEIQMFILQNLSKRFFIFNFNNDLSFSSRNWSYFKSSHPMQQSFCSDTKFTSNTPWNCIQEKINAFTIWIRKQNCISTYRNIFNYNFFFCFLFRISLRTKLSVFIQMLIQFDLNIRLKQIVSSLFHIFFFKYREN